jgi:cobalt-precorrin-5B (C1)-methyltransferase
MNSLSAIRQINGKTYRYGYTTGSCAAAASKAAAIMLLTRHKIDEVTLTTPSGISLNIALHDINIGDNAVSCSVIKDSGDDPDVTNGIKVFAKAKFNSQNKLIVKAGIGIGTVTKKGLQVAVGKPAINPAPMKMIVSEVSALLQPNQSITVEIWVPQGEEIARKTFNERLGVVGGISILGTSGIVVPMSEEAFKESLALELSVLKEKGCCEVLLTPGNYGEAFISAHIPAAMERTVTTSNFIGYMLHEAVRFEMQKVLLVGHIGKLVKVAGGIFHTHSSVADARNEILAAHYMKFSGDAEGFRNIMESNTTEEAIEFVRKDGFFDYLCDVIQCRCHEHIRNKCGVEVMIFSQENGMLGKTTKVNDWIKTYFENA